MTQPTLTLLNDIFVQSPGDFLFFLVVMALNLVSLLMSFTLTSTEDNAHQRYTIALAGIVFAWSLLFAGVLFIRFTGQNPTTILPPLERAIMVASLLLLAWAFLTADHARWRKSSNTLVLVLLLVVAIAYAITGILWIETVSQTETDFNLGVFGSVWVFTLFAIPIFGMLLTILLFGDAVDAPLKLLYFFVVTLGGAATIYQMSGPGLIGNDLGLFRLSYTLAQVIVPLIVYRVVLRQYDIALEDRSIRGRTPIPPPQIAMQAPAPAEPPRISQSDALNAQLLKAMGMMLETGIPDDIPAQIVNTILDILKADVGALLRLQDVNYADITVAQNRMMSKKIAAMSLNFDNQPTLVNAIERRAQRGLYPDRNYEELEDLYERMYIEQRGPVYFQPLIHSREVFAVVMIAMPYTKRELRAEEIELLKGIGTISGSLLAVSYASIEQAKYAEDQIIQAMVEGIAPSTLQQGDTLQAREGMQQKLATARQEIQSLTKQVSELNYQLVQEQDRMLSLLGDTESDLTISQRITTITDEQIKLREEREQLMKRVNEAEAAMRTASGTSDETAANHLIETLQHEKEILEVEKLRLQKNLEAMRSQDQSPVPADMQRLINRMMEEKNALETERDQLNDKLDNVQSELQALGIDNDITGLSQWIAQLSEERSTLRKQAKLLQQERDTLLKERSDISNKIDSEKDRDQQITALQNKIEQLAGDKDIALRQRDKLRADRADLVNRLNTVKEHRARLLAESSGYEIELSEVREEQAELRAQVQELAEVRGKLITERDRLIAENTALTIELEQALSQMDGDPSRMKAVNEEGIGSLKAMIEDLSEQRNELEQKLSETTARLQETEKALRIRDVAQAAANGNPDITYEPNEPELLVGLVQELRTPMTSISGYVELLLSESAGILGEMQRKFLQRVGANISRLESMIDSLVHVTQLDTGNYELEPQPIDLVHLVEEAITNASMQFREKGLAVTLDLDEGIPRLPADEDGMKQVIGQLLTNAYLISPPDSDIHVTVVRRMIDLDNDGIQRNSVYFAIQDSGGGISADDVPRVFARKYKAENPLIEGLGDTGVGMSIAKALVEAHEGQLWVETEEGTGSVFAFAIPLDLELVKKRD